MPHLVGVFGSGWQWPLHAVRLYANVDLIMEIPADLLAGYLAIEFSRGAFCIALDGHKALTKAPPREIRAARRAQRRRRKRSL